MIAKVKEGWAGLKGRYQQLLADYGYGALGVWFTIFFCTWGGFYVAIQSGMDLEGAAGSAGTIGGAYVMTQATKPVRIIATLVLTPIVVGTYRRMRGLPAVSPAPVVAEEAVEKA